ncbi:N-acetylmuramoyl-L-alanine amidase [Helicobacter didelphidarum]|uniref:N-acetylmuramoyl-L-alanine amidase n=1 Tax=Helicobacter didelphidarum TaxID=2040648 RepID=A0A3D8ILY2_9HELI|nr:N-acetylmuramoyl-L-alanine amidase [Helicobacter didelphidarum]RDU66133.1 N-acetylmuramoyl-L-alanine amidase [Helicobacter didelphidarum]
MRFIVLFAILTFGLYGDTLRIIGSVPFGSSSLRLEANRNIQKKDISVHKLNDTSTFIDIYGVWTPASRKEYNFPNRTQITIAQNNKQRLRILLTLTSKTDFEYSIKNKFFYIAIKEKVSIKKATTTPTSKPIQNHSSNQQQGKVTPVKTPIVKPRIDKKNQPKPILVSKAKPTDKAHKKIVILDAGHGGKDCGTQGVAQTCEKTIVLSVAQLTARELDKQGYVVYMTRNSDVFIELQRRTEMANEIHADLFVSIHANSMPVGSSRQPKGVETYFLSTARTERAVNVAANENQGMAEYSPTTIASFLTSQRIIASNKLGMDVQSGVLKQIRTMYNENLDGGVREGPFWVLVGALMPSVLIEIGYNSNPIEAKRLKDPKYQALIAKGIANGINGYIKKNP